MTPTARALAECRRRGWLACVVEKYIPQTRQRKDAFGFGDLLAVDGKRGALLLQVTSSDHVSHRVTKIQTECAEAARAWLAAGNRIAVWGYGKRGQAGARKLWTLREVAIESIAQERPDADSKQDPATRLHPTRENAAQRSCERVTCMFGLPGACTNCHLVKGASCAMRRLDRSEP